MNQLVISRLVTFFLTVLTIVAIAIAVWPKPADCEYCDGRECYYHVNCDVGCICVKFSATRPGMCASIQP